VEWTIVAVGLSSKAAAPYKDLCLATGGAFLNASGSAPTSAASKRFLSEVQRAHSRGSGAALADRVAAKRAYERGVAEGTAQRFEWYAALPPPEDRK
jgi:hypothetical protein